MALNKNGIKYNIQNVNNFHSQIDDILNRKFKGVNTNYLISYIIELNDED